MNNQPDDDRDNFMTPVDTWILSGHAFLQEKYKINPSEYLEIKVENSTVIVNADCTQIGSWLAEELWMRRAFLVEKGWRLKVLTGGKVIGDLPHVKDTNID